MPRHFQMVQNRSLRLSIDEWLLALLVLFFSLAFFYSHGSSDVDRFWFAWMNTMAQYGSFREGFAAVTVTADYPPGSVFILFLIKKASILYGWDAFVLLKLVILAFLLATTICFFCLTGNFALALLMHFFMLPGSMLLGYLDIFYAPFLLLSLWAVSERKFTQAISWFCVCCALKYQPLIIAPFGMIYIWKEVRDDRPGVSLEVWKTFSPVVIYLLAMVLWVGKDFFLSFYNGLLHSRLSFQGLNGYWVYMQLRVMSGELIQQVRGANLWVLYGSRLVFAGVYLLGMWCFAQHRKTYIEFLLFALVGFYSYFILISGVHENHLFVAVMVASCLYIFSEAHRTLALFVMIMNVINLLMFNGLSGAGLGFSPLFLIDMTIPLAVVNTLFYIYLCSLLFFRHTQRRMAS